MSLFQSWIALLTKSDVSFCFIPVAWSFQKVPLQNGCQRLSHTQEWPTCTSTVMLPTKWVVLNSNTCKTKNLAPSGVIAVCRKETLALQNDLHSAEEVEIYQLCVRLQESLDAARGLLIWKTWYLMESLHSLISVSQKPRNTFYSPSRDSKWCICQPIVVVGFFF